MTILQYRQRRAAAPLAAALAAMLATPFSASAADAIYVCADPGPRLLRLDIATGERRIVSGEVVSSVRRLAWRAAGAEMIAAEPGTKTLYQFATGATPAPLAAPGLGGGYDLASIAEFTDVANHPGGRSFAAARLVGNSSSLVVEIDPATGFATPITGFGFGGGSSASGSYLDLAAEPGGATLVVNNNISLPQVMRVEIATGVRSILSNSSGAGPIVGGGDMLTDLNALDVAPDGSIYVLGYRGSSIDGSRGAIVRIDPATGDRSTVSNNATGTGPSLRLGISQGDVVAIDNGTLLSISHDREVLLVDVATGDRTVVAGDAVGSGVPFVQADSLAYDAAAGTAFYFDASSGEAVAIDLATGARALAWDNDVGGGPGLVGPEFSRGLDAMAEEAPGRVVGVGRRDLLAGGVEYYALRVDLRDGARSILSDSSTGVGTAISRTVDLVVEASGDLVVAEIVGTGANAQGRLLRVDADTGDRSLFPGQTGPVASPVGIALDRATGHVYFAERNRILRYDPAGSPFVVVADAATGTGPAPLLDAVCFAGDGLLYATHGLPATTLLAIDPATGDRSTAYSTGNVVLNTDLETRFQGRPLLHGPSTRQFTLVMADGSTALLAQSAAGSYQPSLLAVLSFAVADDGVEPSHGLAVR